MNRSTFQQNFRSATEKAVTFARNFVNNVLPEGRLFLLYPNQSYDENPLRSDETLYPADTLPDGTTRSVITEEEVVSFLWRGGKIPEWIDVSVLREVGPETVLRLICCGRFTSDEHLLYYKDAYPPFGIKSPDLPPRWTLSNNHDKFDLHWKNLSRWPPGFHRHP
jgi:hypothetical protein